MLVGVAGLKTSDVEKQQDDPATDSVAIFRYGCWTDTSVWARQQLPVYLYVYHCRGQSFGASEDNSRGQNAAHRVEDAVDEGQVDETGDVYFSVFTPALPASYLVSDLSGSRSRSLAPI